MDIGIQLSSSALADDDLDDLTRQLAQTITSETDIDVGLPERDTAPGAKGDAITLGSLVLTFISSGAAVALFEVLKTYFAREPSLEIALKRADGAEVTVSARNLAPGQLHDTMERMRKLVES